MDRTRARQLRGIALPECVHVDLIGSGDAELLEEPLQVKDGALIVSMRPGLGRRVDVGYLEAHEVGT